MGKLYTKTGGRDAVTPPQEGTESSGARASRHHDRAVLFLFLLSGLVVFLLTLELYRVDAHTFPRSEKDFLPESAVLRALQNAQKRLERNPDDLHGLTQMTIARYQQMDRHFPEFCVPREEDPAHYQRSHHHVESLQSLERARSLGAVDARLFYYAGVMYEAGGLPEFAQTEYEKFLRSHPKDIDALVRLGNLFYKTNHWGDALQTYEQAHALAPNNPLVNFNRGVAYSEQGRHAEAQAALSRALAKEGTLPPLGFYHLGKSFAAQNAWGQALDYFHREMSISPDFVPLHEAMAHAYEASGDIAAAQAAWERVLGIKGSHREARRKIAALSKISNVRR